MIMDMAPLMVTSDESSYCSSSVLIIDEPDSTTTTSTSTSQILIGSEERKGGEERRATESTMPPNHSTSIENLNGHDSSVDNDELNDDDHDRLSLKEENVAITSNGVVEEGGDLVTTKNNKSLLLQQYITTQKHKTHLHHLLHDHYYLMPSTAAAAAAKVKKADIDAVDYDYDHDYSNGTEDIAATTTVGDANATATVTLKDDDDDDDDDDDSRNKSTSLNSLNIVKDGVSLQSHFSTIDSSPHRNGSLCNEFQNYRNLLNDSRKSPKGCEKLTVNGQIHQYDQEEKRKKNSQHSISSNNTFKGVKLKLTQKRPCSPLKESFHRAKIFKGEGEVNECFNQQQETTNNNGDQHINPLNEKDRTPTYNFFIGEDVLIKKKDQRFYLGTVIENVDGEQYRIRFDDHTELCCRGNEIRKLRTSLTNSMSSPSPASVVGPNNSPSSPSTFCSSTIISTMSSNMRGSMPNDDSAIYSPSTLNNNNNNNNYHNNYGSHINSNLNLNLNFHEFSQPMCVVCKRNEPEWKVERCERCGRGYHYRCTLSVSPNANEWWCKRCSKPMKLNSMHDIEYNMEEERVNVQGNASTKRKLCFSLPYNWLLLHWDKKHRVNEEQIYCYCGKTGQFDQNMLQCCRCLNWYHTECIQTKLAMMLLRGDGFFVFSCSVCNQGPEFLRRLQMSWLDVVHLILYNLSLKKRYHQKYFHLIKEILPFSLQIRNSLSVSEKDEELNDEEFKEIICKTLKENHEHFICAREGKRDNFFYGLRHMAPPIIPEIQIRSDQVLNDEFLTDVLRLPIQKPNQNKYNKRAQQQQQRKKKINVNDNHQKSICHSFYDIYEFHSDEEVKNGFPSENTTDENKEEEERADTGLFDHNFKKYFEGESLESKSTEKNFRTPSREKLTIDDSNDVNDSSEDEIPIKHIIDKVKKQSMLKIELMNGDDNANDALTTLDTSSKNHLILDSSEKDPTSGTTTTMMMMTRETTATPDEGVEMEEGVSKPSKQELNMFNEEQTNVDKVTVNNSNADDVEGEGEVMEEEEVELKQHDTPPSSTATVQHIDQPNSIEENTKESFREEKPLRNSRRRKTFSLSRMYNDNSYDHHHHYHHPHHRLVDPISSSDENSSCSSRCGRTSSLDLMIPPPKNFLGQNNPFRIVSPKKQQQQQSMITGDGIFTNFGANHLLGKAAGKPRTVRTVKRKLSAKDITIGPNQEVRRRRTRKGTNPTDVEVISTTIIMNQQTSHIFPMHAKDILGSSIGTSTCYGSSTLNKKPKSSSSTNKGVSQSTIPPPPPTTLTNSTQLPAHGRRLRQRPQRFSPDTSRRNSIASMNTATTITTSFSAGMGLMSSTALPTPTSAMGIVGETGRQRSSTDNSDYQQQQQEQQQKQQDLKETVNKYFGVMNRIESGEKFTICAKRKLPDGTVQYLIEWGETCQPLLCDLNLLRSPDNGILRPKEEDTINGKEEPSTSDTNCLTSSSGSVTPTDVPLPLNPPTSVACSSPPASLPSTTVVSTSLSSVLSSSLSNESPIKNEQEEQKNEEEERKDEQVQVLVKEEEVLVRKEEVEEQEEKNVEKQEKKKVEKSSQIVVNGTESDAKLDQESSAPRDSDSEATNTDTNNDNKTSGDHNGDEDTATVPTITEVTS